jgi:Raf kinase inhibitor-like YbhB/YbcL family protein
VHLVTWLAASLSLGSLIAQPAAIALRSPAFKDNEAIPLTYSGYGSFKSPPLAWTGLPRATRELALIVHDPDVPLERFATHWVLYNIPAAATGLPEGLTNDATLSLPAALKGATQGLNALKRTGYLPPRPFAGSGVHHYTFTVYALDADLPLAEGLDRQQLLDAMKGHVIGQGVLVGLFEQKEP